MKRIVGSVLACCLASGVASAQSNVSLTISETRVEHLISPDFNGVSFETGSLRYGRDRKDAYFFDSSNTQLITLFRNLGVRSLRIGGDSVEEYTPSTKDIDLFFVLRKPSA